MLAAWNGPSFQRSHVLTLRKFTKVDRDSMDGYLDQSYTIEDGEEQMSTPMWGGAACTNSAPRLPTFAGLAMLVAFMVN